MPLGFWLFFAVVWIGLFGTGIAAWNSSFQFLRDPSRRDDWTVIRDGDAFLPEGQRLRRRAFVRWGVGVVVLALYYGIVAPRLG